MSEILNELIDFRETIWPVGVSIGAISAGTMSEPTIFYTFSLNDISVVIGVLVGSLTLIVQAHKVYKIFKPKGNSDE